LHRLARATLIAALLSSVACSRATPDQAEASAASGSPEYSLVWGDTAKGVRSYWLELLNGKLRIAGEASGALLLAGGELYRFRQLPQNRELLNSCPPENAEPTDAGATVEGAPPAGNQRTITVFGAEAERITGSGTVQISEAPSVENATLFSNSIALRASAGPYLFVESHSDAVYCGAAHGSTQAAFETFDLASQKFTTSPTKAELAELRALALHNERASLLACLAQRVGPDGQKLGSEALSELEAWNAFPVVAPSGKLTFELELGMMRSHAEGAIRCPVKLQPVPASLFRFVPPRGLDAFRMREAKVVVRGWSSLAPSELSRAPAIARAFAEQARTLENR
jgi:hypothetical protein